MAGTKSEALKNGWSYGYINGGLICGYWWLIVVFLYGYMMLYGSEPRDPKHSTVQGFLLLPWGHAAKVDFDMSMGQWASSKDVPRNDPLVI